LYFTGNGWANNPGWFQGQGQWNGWFPGWGQQGWAEHLEVPRLQESFDLQMVG
jgi:signal-transduction protein with cAMP-binding, CBS, and nucleotidyltransferase domain